MFRFRALCALLVCAQLAAAQTPPSYGYTYKATNEVVNIPYFGDGSPRPILRGVTGGLVVSVPRPPLTGSNSREQVAGGVLVKMDAGAWHSLASPFGNAEGFGDQLAAAGNMFVVSDVAPDGNFTFHVYQIVTEDGRRSVRLRYKDHFQYNVISALSGFTPAVYDNAQHAIIDISVSTDGMFSFVVAVPVSNTTHALVTWSGEIFGSMYITPYLTFIGHNCDDPTARFTVEAAAGAHVFFAVASDNGPGVGGYCGCVHALQVLPVLSWQDIPPTYLSQATRCSSVPSWGSTLAAMPRVMQTTLLVVSGRSVDWDLVVYGYPSDGIVDVQPYVDREMPAHAGGGSIERGVGFEELMIMSLESSFNGIFARTVTSNSPGAQIIMQYSANLDAMSRQDGWSIDCSRWSTPNGPVRSSIGGSLAATPNGASFWAIVCSPVGAAGPRDMVIRSWTTTLVGE